MRRATLLALAFVLWGMNLGFAQKQGSTKPRTIVTCDPELDDNNSMIRFLLHATDFQIDGLVYTSSRFHWRGDGKGTTQFIKGSEYDHLGLGPQTSWRFKKDERFIHDILDAYEKSYANLKVHDPGYPTPAYLKSVTVYGNCNFEGDYSENTDGSNLVKKNILDDKPGPLFIQAWGGTSTIAAALRSIEDDYKNTPQWGAIYKKICDKIVLCLSGDQDNAYNKYVAINWPDMYVQNVTGGMGRYDNSAYKYLMSPEWTAKNLRLGPIGALVRCWGDGKQMVPGDKLDMMGPYKGESIEELARMGYIVWRGPEPIGTLYDDGDSPCFYNLIDNGLNAWMDPTWGGWTGRWDPKSGVPKSGHPAYMSMDINMLHNKVLEAARAGKPTDLASIFGLGNANAKEDHSFPNMYPERNLSEAARMKWSVTPNYKDANHYPVVTGTTMIGAKAGETIRLNAKVSDPDGNKVTTQWWYFPVGTYQGGAIAAKEPGKAKTSIKVPEDAKPGDTIHMVLQATDNGTPALTRYLRVIVTVEK